MTPSFFKGNSDRPALGIPSHWIVETRHGPTASTSVSFLLQFRHPFRFILLMTMNGLYYSIILDNRIFLLNGLYYMYNIILGQ